MKAYKFIIALMGAFLVSACMPFSSAQRPAPLVYTLQGPPAPGQQVKEDVAHVIAVTQPGVPAGFDTDKIALYLYNQRRLDYYKNAVWPEPLGKLVQEVILQSMRTLPHIIAVAGGSGFPATDELWIKVNDLEPVYAAGPAAPPQLKVSLSFRLLSLTSRRVLLEATYSATAPATANTQTAIVTGLEALLHSVDRRALREIHRAF